MGKLCNDDRHSFADLYFFSLDTESTQKKHSTGKTEKALFITLEFVHNLLKWQKIVKVIVKM